MGIEGSCMRRDGVTQGFRQLPECVIPPKHQGIKTRMPKAVPTNLPLTSYALDTALIFP